MDLSLDSQFHAPLHRDGGISIILPTLYRPDPPRTPTTGKERHYPQPNVNSCLKPTPGYLNWGGNNF